jgi:hypothetical protein
MENNYEVDYSQFYLEAKKQFKSVEEAVNNKDYSTAEKHAMNAMVEMKLLWNSLQMLKDKDRELWEKHDKQD